MSIKTLAEEFGVSESAVSAALKGLNPDTLTDVEREALRNQVQSGKLSSPKPVPPAKSTAAPLAVAPKPAETDRPAESAPASTVTDKKALLLAEIENLKAQKELADLEKQALALKAELLAVQAEVLTVGTDLAEQENSHKLWAEAAPGLADMAAQNGKLIAEDAIGRQKTALGELRTVSQEIKLNSEIAVEALRQQQVVQDNRWQEIRNKTPAALPPMSQEAGRSEMKTVETVAV